MSGVRFDPPVMIRAAGRLEAIAEDLGGAAAAVRGVPTAGLPPELATSARVVLSEAGCDLGAAQATTDRAAREIVRRAALAVALDDGGGGRGIAADLRRLKKGLGTSWRRFLADLKDPNGWDAAGLLNTIRKEGREWLTDTRTELGRTRKLKWAQRYWDENAWVRRRFKSAKDLQKLASHTFGMEVRDLEKATRLLDRLDPAGHLPKGLRKNPLTKRIPGLGEALTFSEGISEGRGVPEAAEKAAAQAAGSAGGAALGGAACGTAAAASFGLGAATCPVLITGGAFVGDYVVGKAYDPFIKPVSGVVADGGKKVVEGGKKVVGFVGGLVK